MIRGASGRGVKKLFKGDRGLSISMVLIGVAVLAFALTSLVLAVCQGRRRISEKQTTGIRRDSRRLPHNPL